MTRARAQSWWTGLVVAALSATLGGCTPPPPPPAAPEPPPQAPPEPPPPPPEPAPTPDPPVHECGQDPAKESPIVEGVLGDGERVVRLINNSGTVIQARLLAEDLSVAVPGTLHIPPGKRGEFRVAAGVYRVRYRHGSTCEVRRGTKLELTGPRAGVEIAIKPSFDKGTKSQMMRVSEEL